MPINLISKIKPKNDGDFPVIEDIDICGGYQVREDTTDRNTIPLLNRKEGMLVYVKDISKYYTLSGGLSDGYWVEKNFGGSAGLTQVILTNENRLVESGNNEFIVSLNTDGVSRTIMLPENPSIGQEIICSRPGNRSMGYLEINANGKYIDVSRSSWGMQTGYESIVHLIYDETTWILIY